MRAVASELELVGRRGLALAIDEDGDRCGADVETHLLHGCRAGDDAERDDE